MEPYVEVQDGQSIDAIDVMQVILGITGGRAVAHVMVADDAAATALTVQNTAAGGVALKVKNTSGSDRFRFGPEIAGDDGSTIDVFRMMEGSRMIYAKSDGAMHTAQRLVVDDKDASTNAVPAFFTYENNAVVTSDVATALVLGIQRTGDSYFRALEIDMVAITGTSTWPKQGIELSIESSYVGNGNDRTVGIAVGNYGTAWGVPTPQIVDTAYLALYAEHGFTNYFRAIDASRNVLFNVNSLGIVEAKGIAPLTDSTYDSGASAVAWRNVYTDHVALTDLGTVGTPAISFQADTNTGLFQAAASADTLSLVNGGVETIRVTSAGILDFRNSQPFAVSGGAAATLGGISGVVAGTAQSHWLQIRHSGTLRYVPVWT